MSGLIRLRQDDGFRSRRRDRSLPKRMSGDALQVVEEVRLAALKADGAIELGKHLCDELADFSLEVEDRARHSSTATAMVLAEIEATTVSKVQKIQRGLYNTWGI